MGQLTMKDLNPREREDLTEQFVEIVVDNMDIKDLVRYAQEQLIDNYNQYSLEELKEDVDNYQDELYDELVDNVTIKSDVALSTMNTDNLPDINDNEAEGITE